MTSSRPPRHRRKWFFYAGITLLVIFALGLTTVRLLLFQADDYRSKAEQRISAFLGQPIRIGSMNARLLRLSPKLILRSVTLLDKISAQPIADFREIQLTLAPLATLQKLTPVLDEVTVVGASLEVERRADGSFHIAGFATPKDSSSDPEAVGRWLLAQHRLNLRDARVVWHDRRTQRHFEFDHVSLEMRNSGARHQLSGSLRLPKVWGGVATVAVDMEGDPFVAGGARGALYVKAKRLRPAGLLRELPIENVRARDGHLSVELWGEWDGLQLRGIEGGFEGEQFVFSGPRHDFQLARTSGRVKWAREAGGWQLDVSDLVLARGGREWEPARIRVDLEKSDTDPVQRSYRLQASFLRLEDMAAIAALVPAGKGWQKELHTLAPKGDLRQVQIDYATSGEIVAGAAFADLGAHIQGQRAQFSGLDGYLHYAGGEAVLHLLTRNGTLDFPRLFREPLKVSSLDGDAHLRREGGGWLLSVRDIALANEDVRAQGDLRIRLPKKGAPFLELQTAFQQGRAASVHRYLPAKIMPARAVDWLDHAFKRGEVISGGLLFYGRTADFPFEKGQGRFEVRFSARDVDLDYHPGWPRLTNVAGEVLFDGQSMKVHADSAQLMNSHIGPTKVSIPNLSHARLSVQGHVEGALPNLFTYLRETGLANGFSEPLERFRTSGNYDLDLHFEHPLSDGPAGHVKGDLTFRNGSVAVTPGIEFTKVNGTLRFDESRYFAQKIDLQLFGEPATLDVATAGKERVAKTWVSLKGSVDAPALRSISASPWLARLEGRTRFEGQLSVDHAEPRESVLRVQSHLEGISVDLPAPLAKSATESRNLDLGIWLSGPRAGELEMELEHGFTAAISRTPEGGVDRAAIHFGDKLPLLPAEPQIRVTGRLLAFSPAAWKETLATMRSSTVAPEPKTSEKKPLPVVLDMKELRFVSGPTAAGKLAPGRALTADQFPLLKVQVERLGYDKLDLGRLTFHTVETPTQVQLRELSLVNPAYNVTANGEWQTGPVPRVRLNLVAKGADLGVAVRRLAIASVVSKGDFRFESQIGWEGTPDTLDLARLKGTLKVRIKEGILDEVRPGAGRLLGLLSLQALPHRLTLDFRDIFDDGMRFRTLDGDFTLKDGNAITDNLRMNALPAAVLLRGRTGFIRRDFDQRVTVVPDVSGSLPVAGGLVLGPQVGAALLLLQQLFHRDIDEAAKITYSVTGSWDQPSIKRITDTR